MTPSTQDARATGLVEKRDTTDAHYARCGPPHSPCWHCVMPSVCPFEDTCPVYAAGVSLLKNTATEGLKNAVAVHRASFAASTKDQNDG